MPRTKLQDRFQLAADGETEELVITAEQDIVPKRKRHDPYWTPAVDPEPEKAEPVKPSPYEPIAHRFPDETSGAWHERRWQALLSTMAEGLFLKQVLQGTLDAHRASDRAPDEPPAAAPRARASQLLRKMEGYRERYQPVLSRLVVWNAVLQDRVKACQASLYDGSPSAAIADLSRALRHPISVLSAVGPAPEIDPDNEQSLQDAVDDAKRVREIVKQMQLAPAAFVSALRGLVDRMDRYQLRWQEGQNAPLSMYSAFRGSPPAFAIATLAPPPPRPAPRRDAFGDLL